jgi:hypothetical protein
MFIRLICLVSVFIFVMCGSKKENNTDLELLKKRVDAYADVTISFSLAHFTQNQHKVIHELIATAKQADNIFWQQSSHDAIAVREAYQEIPGPLHKYIMINYGPYDRIHALQRFVGNGPAFKPKGAGFYPESVTKEVFEAYVAKYPEQKRSLENSYTVVKSDGDRLLAVPYNQAYQEEIEAMVLHLRNAADVTENASLRHYLLLRADALLSNDYYQSDLAWMELKDNQIDCIIGPIENSEDGLFNYKGAFESAVMVKDIAASRQLDLYKAHMDELERNLPIDDKYKKDTAGSNNILEVVNVIYFAGEFMAGIKTIASSLPNDERVTSQKGAKKQLYRNILEAKYEEILVKLSDKLIYPGQRHFLSKKAFVFQVLFHELAHTLGPEYVFGSDATVRRALEKYYSPIEECKADVLGIYCLDYFRRNLNYSMEEISQYYITFIAGLLRSIRFGHEEVHGSANLIQLNFLLDEGVVIRDNATGTYRLDVDAFHPAIRKLANRLLMVEATGDINEAQKMIGQYGKISSQVLEDIKVLAEIPTDLHLQFSISD